MSGRLLVVVAVFAATLGVAAPAMAFTPLWSQPVNGAARLVAGREATVVWAADSAGTTSLLGQPYSGDGRPFVTDPVVLVDGVAGLTDWLAAPAPGGDVVLVWKSGGATYASRRTSSGSPVHGPTVVCTDAAVAAARGAGASAAPVFLEADGRGGAYVVLHATPSLAAGDSLLAHVSSTGALAFPSPGLAVPGGTVSAAAADDQAHLFVLLAGPGRNGVAVQRYSPELAPDWLDPIPPYNPLAGPPPAAAQTPVTLIAESTAMAAWREDGRVKVQRYSPGGDRLWLRPSSTDAGDGAQVASDGAGGAYVTWASGDSLRVRHVLGDGSLQDAGAGSTVRTGVTAARVDGVVGDQAGDLSVAYSDASSAGGGVAEMTCLGTWAIPAFSPAATRFSALAGDRAGGAYALGSGTGARLWRVGEAGAALTLRPRPAGVTYGGTVRIGGYLTLDGAPLAGATVKLTPAGGGGDATPVTDGEGFYQAVVKPAASASWTASASGPGGEAIVSDPSDVIVVMPDVSLTLSNTPSGGGYLEIFSGAVKPNHAGSRVRVQRRIGGAWTTIAAGKLNGASRYRVTWRLPLVTATYLIRTVLPAHADHGEGVSRTARLRVVVRPA